MEDCIMIKKADVLSMYEHFLKYLKEMHPGSGTINFETTVEELAEWSAVYYSSLHAVAHAASAVPPAASDRKM